MADNNWKNLLDPVLRGHLEHQLKEVASQKKAYANAPNAHAAQLWVSVSLLSKQIFSLNARLKQLETVIESMQPAKKATVKKTTRKKATKKRTTKK